MSAEIHSSISGWAAWKSSIRGISHLEAKPGAMLIDTCLRRGGSRSRAEASISRSNPSRSRGTEDRPRSVSCRPRASRTNKGPPTMSSSKRICWLTAPGVTDSSSAAREKFRGRAAASKARRALSGSRERAIAVRNPISATKAIWFAGLGGEADGSHPAVVPSSPDDGPESKTMRVFLASIPLEAAKIVIIGGGEPALAKLRLFLNTPAELLWFAPDGAPPKMETPLTAPEPVLRTPEADDLAG